MTREEREMDIWQRAYEGPAMVNDETRKAAADAALKAFREAFSDQVADMLRDDLNEVERDARDMADQLNECARLLGCERCHVVDIVRVFLSNGTRPA